MKGWIKCLAFLAGLTLQVAALAQSTQFVPVTPVRLMDTRSSGTTVDGQFVGGGPVANQGLDLLVVGRGNIPATGVGAVALNITVTAPMAAGYITVWPTGVARPTASNLNFVPGQTIANQVIAKVGTNGKVSIYTAGTAQVIVDVAGYFPSTSNLTGLTPARLLDTRPGNPTVDGQFSGVGAIGTNSTLNLTVLGRGGVPASGVGAVVLNVTVTAPTLAGYVEAWPSGSSQPNASNVNFLAGQTLANLVIVAPGPDGKVSLFNGPGSTHVIADVVGYFTSTVTFAPLVPARLMDTRSGTSTVDGQYAGQGAFGTGVTRNLTVRGRGGVPSSGVGAVALNLTVVTPAAAGYLTAWGTGTTSGNAPPGVSNLNFPAGSILSVLVIAQVGTSGQVSIYNGSTGSTDVIADVVGWFPGADYGPPKPPTSVTVSTGGSNSLIANWTLDSSGPPATYLKIQRATSLSGPWTLINGNYTPATSGQFFDLVYANATYYYEVAACNVAGCSAYTVNGTGATLSSLPTAAISDSPSITSIPVTADSVSDSVGATAAQFRVDEGGNATYSIPIQIPPGTAGVAPKLALSYNSRLPNGVMGPGWTIEGSSQISRCRQTRESGDFGQADGNPSPVNFTASDRFCLDGVRLLLLSGDSANTGKSYGDNGTVYSPETDPTTKVTVSVTGTYVGPDSFTVQRKDGTTSIYGSATSSPNALVTAPNPANIQTTTTVSWNLARVQDSKGNYIDYLYNSRPGSGSLPFATTAVETTLSQVKYTGHASSPVSSPYASINFTYVPLATNLVRMGYQGGVTFVQTQLLSCVTVTSGTTAPTSCTDTGITSSTLRYYSLTYQTSTSGSQFQQLKQIKECRDNSNAVCFLPTKFDWSGANNTFQVGTKYQSQTSPNFGGTGPGNPSNLAGYKIADIDGDGRQDFVWAVNDGLCNVGGNTRSSIYVGFLDRAAGGDMTLTMTNQSKTCAPINLKGNDRAWYLLDYDGDGRADLLIGGAEGSNWAIYSSSGRQTATGGATPVFGTTNLLAGLATPIAVPAGMNAAGVLADVNGDGLPDFVTPDSAEPMNPVSGVSHMAYSGLSVRLLQRSGSVLVFSDPYPIVLTFASGDTTCVASAQVQCTINFFNTNYRNASAITTDVNGDGRADLTFLLQATPCSPSPCQQLAANALPRLYFDPDLGQSGSDQNKTAVLNPTSSYYWYQFTANGISTPTGFSQQVQLMQNYIRLDTGGGLNMPTDGNKVFFADLNGDGLADWIYQDVTTATTYHVMVNFGRGYQAPIDVTGISNGSLLQLVDINGDGKIDLVYPSGSAPFTVYNYQSLVPSTGATNGWSFMASPGTVPGSGLYSYGDWISLISDFDGDGAPDYLGLSYTAVSSNMYTSRAAAGSRYQPRDVITDFTNGLGATTHVAYQPLTNIGVYQRGGTNGYPALTGSIDYGWGSPVFDVLAPMYVVSKASSSAPTQTDATAMSTVYYRYAGALMQAGGRGFLGFYDIWNFDANDSAAVGNQYVAVLNRYAQRYPLTGMPIATLKQALSGTLTFGDPKLDACAADPESRTDCFPGITGTSTSPTFQLSWPSIAGTWFSYSYQTEICAGPGCLVTVPASTCTLGGNNSTQMALRPTDFTKDVFTGSATPGPVFVYVNYTQDTQFDLATSSSSNHVANAGVDNWFCYDGNGTTAGYGNLTGSRTRNTDGALTPTPYAEKIVANTYTDNLTNWQLGRLTESTVTFDRTGLPTRSRTTDFTYDSTSGLLTSERIQSGGSSDQDLRTLYDLDAYGNRTAAYQCSSDLTDAQCKAHSGTLQQQSGTTVLRYAKTSYDSIGRYVTGSSLPFSGAGGAWNEQQATSIGKRDEFGNAVQQKSINDTSGTMINGKATTQWSQFGALGRPYFAADASGKSSTTTYRMCSGANSIPCSNDARFKFRSQTVMAGAPSSWTYYDVLGRPVLQVTRSFDGNGGTNQFAGVCTYADAHNRTTYQSEPFFLPVSPYSDGSPWVDANTAALCSNAQYVTTTTYDVIGRVTRVTLPDSNIINKTYSLLTTTTSSPRNAAWKWTQVTNVLGEVVSTQDPQVTGDTSVGMTVTQTYDVFGDVATIMRNAGNGNIVNSYTYDLLGRKISQSDPDSGITNLYYNAAGDVISQNDAKNQTITQSYDAQGRLWQRTTSNAADGNDLTDIWTYDLAANGYGQLSTESRSGTGSGNTAFKRKLAYDNKGRLATRTTTIGTTDYPETTVYDSLGRVKAQTDITGHYASPNYSANGYTSSLTDSRIGTFYQLLTTTARGQTATDQRGNSTALQSQLTYYAATGRLNTVCSGLNTTCNLQDLQYHFDAAGNLDARARAVHGATTQESFTYDALNRLKTAGLVKVNGINQAPAPTLSLTYDKLGNICTKSPLSGGTINYQYAGPAGCSLHGSAGSPHAAVYVAGKAYGYDANGNQTTNDDGRAISYNVLNQVTQSVENGTIVSFQYGPDGDRFLRTDSNASMLTYYVGKAEIRFNPGNLNIRRYLGVAIDFVRATGGNETRYVFNDHLGSTDVIATATGQVYESESFDVHGNRRDPQSWQGSAPAIATTNIGFTGQEHVDSQSFIHFNGRIYDPQLGRMLQADPVQNPGSQGLNRYAYVANNPLTLTDPSGYSWFGDLLKVAAVAAISYFSFGTLAPIAAGWFGGSAVLGGMFAGAVAGFASGVIMTGTLQGGLIGAFTGAVMGGIGGYFQSAGWAYDTGVSCSANMTTIGATGRAVAMGLASGVMSTLQGGKFGSGFLSAGLSAFLMPSVDSTHNASLQYTEAALVGGTTSVISGGKFANGAETAMMELAISDGLDAAARQSQGGMTPQASMLAEAAGNSYRCNDGGLMGIYGIDYKPTAGFSACLTMGWDGSLIMAYRGTEPTSLLDWRADGQNAFNLDSRQYDQARTLALDAWKATDGNIMFTGHSLGGGLAAAASYATGGSAITFNAAGLAPRYRQGTPGSIANYQINGDVLSTLQHFFPFPNVQGTQIMLAPMSPWQDPVSRHSSDNFIGR